MSNPIAEGQFELPTEPSTIGGVLDTGITLFRQCYRTVIPVAVVSAIPYLIISSLLNSQMAAIDPEVDPELAIAASTQALIYLPFLYMGLIFIVTCVISSLNGSAKGNPGSMTTHLTNGVRVLIPLTLVMCLYGVLITIGLIALVIPGLIIAISMSLFAFVPIVEDRSPWSSLWRSHKLVWGGNWGRTLAVLSVASIIAMVLSVISYFGIGVFAFTSPTGEYTTTRIVVEGLLGLVSVGLVMPITMAMSYALYNDLLLRKEGSDLEEKLRDLGPNAASET